MTVHKRGNSFVARPYISGKHVYLGSWSIKKYGEEEAKRLAQEAHDSLLARSSLGGLEPVEDFAKRWVEDYSRPKESTNRTNRQKAGQVATDSTVYEAAGVRFILPRLRLRDVDRQIARAYVRQNRSLLPVLRAMWNDAVEDGLIESNPFAKLGHKQSKGRANIVPLTEAELHLLADTAVDVHGGSSLAGESDYGLIFRSLILVAGYTGLREGEMFGLEPSDIDWKAKEVNVRRRVYAGEVDAPKNGLIRTVALPGPAGEALRSVPTWPHPTHFPSGEPSHAIFRTKRGRPFASNSSLYWYWNPVRKAFESKLPAARRRELSEHRPKGKGKTGSMEVHELRHFTGHHLYATLGLPAEVVAEQLGHTDGGDLVRKLYGHPDRAAYRDRIRAAFGQNVRTLRAVDAEEATG